MTPVCRSRNNTIAWAAASAAALLYFVTSLVAVIGAFLWVGIWPEFWYAMQKAIYLPFQPYFNITLSVMGRAEIPFPVYAVVSRLPFLVVPALIWAIALRRSRSRCTSQPGEAEMTIRNCGKDQPERMVDLEEYRHAR